MQRRVQFTHTGHSHLVGNFSAGDLYTGSPEACRHFVEEAGCAQWADLPPPAPPPPEIEPELEPEPEPEPVQPPAQPPAKIKKR